MVDQFRPYLPQYPESGASPLVATILQLIQHNQERSDTLARQTRLDAIAKQHADLAAETNRLNITEMARRAKEIADEEAIKQAGEKISTVPGALPGITPLTKALLPQPTLAASPSTPTNQPVPQVPGPTPEPPGATTAYNANPENPDAPLSPTTTFLARLGMARSAAAQAAAQKAAEHRAENIVALPNDPTRFGAMAGKEVDKATLALWKPEGTWHPRLGPNNELLGWDNPTMTGPNSFRPEAPGAYGTGGKREHLGLPGESGVSVNDPNTIPAQYRNQVLAIAEGRQKAPSLGNRPGSPGFLMMQMVNDYDPAADFNTVNARWAARQELTKGGVQSRGQALTSLDQLAGHAKELIQASKDLTAEGISPHDFEIANKGQIAITPSAKGKSLQRYTINSNGVKDEFIKMLGGGVPSVTEQAALNAISNPALAPTARDEAINTVLDMAKERANAQEDWYRRTFGKPSPADKHPLLGRNWKYTQDNGWEPNLSKSANRPDIVGPPEEAGAPPVATPAATTGAVVKWGRDAQGNPVPLSQ